MSRAFASCVVFCVVLCVAFCAALCPGAARANLLPPGNIFFDVMPYDTWGDCLTSVTRCEDADASVPGTGAYLFHLMIEPPEGYYGVPLTGLSVDLYWPDDWYLGWYSFCGTAAGTLAEYGPNPHHLEIAWPCTNVHEEAFPALTLAFYSTSYGAVYPEHNEEGAIQMGCPPAVDRIWPFLSFAEAGTSCDHEVDSCEWIYPFCAPLFSMEEFHLAGPSWGTAHGVFPFVTWEGEIAWCAPSAAADSAWLQARVEPRGTPWGWNLVLDADLASMEPGTHTTDVYIAARDAGRCLPAVLEVEAASGIEPPGPADGSVRGAQLQVTGANPSGGSFELAYESRAEGEVDCAVFDASGREVAMIEGLRAPGAGRHTITWDGCGPDGRRVRPGVYLVRMIVDGERRLGRVVVVR